MEVSQGSVLGPMIFFIFINNLSTYINEYCIALYADDI